MKKLLTILLLCVSVSVVKAEDKKEKDKQSVKDVAKELKQLLLPSDLKRAANKTILRPYFRIVEGKDGRSTLIYRFRYIKAKSSVNGLESIISPSGTVEYSEEQNIVIVNDKSDKIQELKDAVVAMDISTPQILVEAKVVEVLLGDGTQRDFSFNFQRHDQKQNLTSNAGITTRVPGQQSGDENQGGQMDWYPYIAGQLGENYKNFQVAVQWLMTASSAKILSSPNIIVSLGASASIVTGQDIPIQTIQVVSGSTTTSTDFKRVGVKLNVTPHIINADSVMLEVSPEVSNVQRYESITQGDGVYPVPVIAVRNISTELTLKDGQIIMLGGLYLNNESDNEEKIPVLCDIPFIGEFFSGKNMSREKTQLIFFLKINVLSEDEIAEGIIYDPGRQAEEINKAGEIIQNSKQIFPDRGETSIEKIKDEMMKNNILFDKQSK